MAGAGDVIQLSGAQDSPPAGDEHVSRELRAKSRPFFNLLDRESFLVLALAACATFQFLNLRASIMSDSWLTLLAGRIEVSSWLPRHDHLTVLGSGREWIDQQWLAHVTLYELWNVGGWRIALGAIAAFFLAALVVCASVARREGASSLAVALVAVPAFLIAYPNTILRAQVPAYLLFALVLGLLLEDARGRPSRRVYVVFPLLALWANVHGSVVVGAGLVAVHGILFAIERLRRRESWRTWLPKATVLAILPWPCLLVSPYGFSLPAYYGDVFFNSSFGRFVTEWNPSTLQSQPLFFCVALAGLWLVARRGSTTPAFGQVVLLGCTFAGMAAVRNIVWFALAALAILPHAVDDLWQPKAAPRRPRLNIALALAGLVVLATSLLTALSRGDAWYTRAYPEKAGLRVAAAAAADPKLRIYANERYADWLLFAHPQLAGRIAYDARFELLTGPELRALSEFRTQRGTGWRRAADGYRLLVLDPVRERDGIRALGAEPGVWTVYRNDWVAVLGRAGAAAG